MKVNIDYDKLQNWTETDLELIELYEKQISGFDVEFVDMVGSLEKMAMTYNSMPCTKLRSKYGKSLFDVVKACYKLNKVLMNEKMPSWYLPDEYTEHLYPRSEVMETLEDILKKDLFGYIDDEFYDEIENDRNTRKLKNENKS